MNQPDWEPRYLAIALDKGPDSALPQLSETLPGLGINIITTTKPAVAQSYLGDWRPDIMIMDPKPFAGEAGIHTFISRIPLVVLTSPEKDGDMATSAACANALDQGAVNYHLKPSSTENLGWRIRAVLRRYPWGDFARPERIVRVKDFDIDLDRRMVIRQGELVHVTFSEWRLLSVLAARAGQTILREELSQDLWGGKYGSDYQPLRGAIARARKVLKDEQAQHIVTFWNIGYQLKQQLTEDF